MKLTDDFISAYKNLETALRNVEEETISAMKDKLDVDRFLFSDQSVLSFENSLSDVDMQQKVKLVRITRNYIQHHDDGTEFASVSEKEIDFLNKLSEEIESGSKCAGDIAEKFIPVKVSDDDKAAAHALKSAFSKAEGHPFSIPVVSGANTVPYIVSWLDTDTFLSLVSSGKSVSNLSAKAGKKPDYVEIIDGKMPAGSLDPTREYIVTGKGQSIKGIIFRKQQR